MNKCIFSEGYCELFHVYSNLFLITSLPKYGVSKTAISALIFVSFFPVCGNNMQILGVNRGHGADSNAQLVYCAP